MTKLWILSDLHLDVGGVAPDLGRHPDHDVILIAGDLSDGGYDPSPWLLAAFSEAERQRLIYVPGNHDYYGIGLALGADRLRRVVAATGIIVLDNGVTEIDGQRFVGSTLWSDFRAPERSYGMLGDPEFIPDFTPDRWRKLHAEAVDYLRPTVRPGDVVITHHAPSREGLDSRMWQDARLMPFASGYATDLDSLIGDLRPALWVHGPTHVTREYDVGGVPVVSNALGCGAGLHFLTDYVVDIGGYEPNPRGT